MSVSVRVGEGAEGRRTQGVFGKVPEVGRVRKRLAPEPGEFLRDVLHDQNPERLGAKGLLERLKRDVSCVSC